MMDVVERNALAHRLVLCMQTFAQKHPIAAQTAMEILTEDELMRLHRMMRKVATRSLLIAPHAGDRDVQKSLAKLGGTINHNLEDFSRAAR